MSKISVVIPTYNRALFLCEAVESALNQRHRDIEILVVDDGSRDHTSEIIAPYVSAGVVRYLCQENAGVSAARNKGIAEARGEFIAFLDSDDVWMPDHLTHLHRALHAHPEAQMAFSNFLFIGENTDAVSKNESFRTSIKSLLQMGFSACDDGRWLSNGHLLTGLFEVGFPFRMQGCMVNKDFLRRHALQLDEAISYTEEAQFVVEAACHTKIVFVEDVSLSVRRHGDNLGDECYGDKIATSYQRRILKLKELFAGRLAGEERRALHHALWKMQVYLMNERARDGGVRKTISEGMRLLTEVPSYESLKAVTKMIIGASDRSR